MSKLRVVHIFPRRGFFSREGSLEEPVNEFLEKCEKDGCEIVKTIYATCSQTGTINSVLIEYIPNDEAPAQEVKEPWESHDTCERKNKRNKRFD